MAVSQSQIVDLLYKQAFGVTKTDTATNKSPSNEAIASPLLIRGDTQWTQSGQIPGTAAAVAGLIQAYTGANAIQTSADTTTVPIGGIYPTWKTNLTYWIPSEFGSTYNVQVWVDSPGVANPTSTGTQIFADGSGGTGQYYYNYQSGVLNFIGETIPASLTAGKVLYIVGYRYIGAVGVTNLPNGTIVGNLSFTGSNISSIDTNANINLTPNGTGVVVSSSNVYAPTFFGNIVGNISGNITIGGSNTQLIFNDSGLANGNANLTFNKASSLLTLAGILSVTGNTSIGGNVNMNSQWINNVGYPSLSTDAASKSYVDTMVSSGIAYHQPVNVATTTTLATATSGTITYNNGASGVGANLTTTGTFLLIDGANVQTVGTRILVKDEANAVFNGVYEYTSSTVITRTSDADTYGPDSTTDLSINDYFFTLGGIVNEGTAFVVSAPAGTITFGTSNITFSVLSQSQVYDAGTGIAITGTTISANASQTQITAVGTLTSLSVSGNIAAGNVSATTFTGALTGLASSATVAASANSVAGGNVSGQVSNALVAGTVYTAAQPNITSLGTLSSLSVSGNANVGNIGATNGVFTNVSGNGSSLTSINGANVTGNVGNALNAYAVAGANVSGAVAFATTANSVAGGNVSGTVANATFATSAGSATTAGTVTTAAQPNITSTGTLTSLTVSGATSVTGNSALTTTNLTSGANTTAGYITGTWTLTTGSKLNATYADLAEKYVADADYLPGTVLVFGGEHEVTLSTTSDSFRVAGVVTTNPAYTMNNDCLGELIATIALQGRVPVKVIGPVFKGDLLVSSDNGHAIANNIARAGTIIGKSLENFTDTSGVIEVAVGRF